MRTSSHRSHRKCVKPWIKSPQVTMLRSASSTKPGSDQWPSAAANSRKRGRCFRTVRTRTDSVGSRAAYGSRLSPAGAPWWCAEWLRSVDTRSAQSSRRASHQTSDFRWLRWLSRPRMGRVVPFRDATRLHPQRSPGEPWVGRCGPQCAQSRSVPSQAAFSLETYLSERTRPSRRRRPPSSCGVIPTRR